MPINTLEFASNYTSELDKKVIQEAQVGFFADNIMKAKFVGAKTVVIPDVDFVGLSDYNRDSGYLKSGITVDNESYTLTKDRGTQLVLDREDMDETGVANLSGQILGEFIRTKVAPEMDAYTLSKLAGIAKTKKHNATYAEANALKLLNTAINNVQSRAGYDEELVAFVDPVMYSALMNSAEFSRQVIVSDFKKGEINTRIKSLNGVAILPVSAERMRDAYNFKAGTAATSTAAATGGFEPTTNAGYIRALVIPKKGASLVKKHENMRIFTPEQNTDADAYIFNYRLHYDVFVKKSNLEFIETIVTAGSAS